MTMRRFLSFILSVVLLLSMAGTVFASETSTTEIIYLEDGSYLVIETVQSMARSANTTSGFTRITHVAESGETRWRAILTGTFTYDGTSATCTEATVTTYVYADNWYEVSKSSVKSGDTATGSVTMGRTVLGITVAKETYNMTLTCSPNGTLS